MVETTNFRDTYFSRGSANMKVTEYFEYENPDKVIYRFTVEDPSVWTASFSGEYSATHRQQAVRVCLSWRELCTRRHNERRSCTRSRIPGRRSGRYRQSDSLSDHKTIREHYYKTILWLETGAAGLAGGLWMSAGMQQSPITPSLPKILTVRCCCVD